jgi:hypothetical protein
MPGFSIPSTPSFIYLLTLSQIRQLIRPREPTTQHRLLRQYLHSPLPKLRIVQIPPPRLPLRRQSRHRNRSRASFLRPNPLSHQRRHHGTRPRGITFPCYREVIPIRSGVGGKLRRQIVGGKELPSKKKYIAWQLSQVRCMDLQLCRRLDLGIEKICVQHVPGPSI